MEHTLEIISKNVLDKLELLKCPICLDIVENVRELPCRHIFCSNCLETYKKDKDTLSCPLCKKEISKRKFLSRDAALDSLCGFVKTLCDDAKLHHKSDFKTFFSNVYNQRSLNIIKTISECDEIIPQSSEENIIPCSSKLNDKKKLFKKKNLNSSKLVIKTAPKPIELEIKRNSAREEKKKAKPKLGLPRKQNKAKVICMNSSVPNLKPKVVPQHQQNSRKPCSDKNKILRWLHDTRNKFERFSQTQTYETQNNTTLDIDMPSVSQTCYKNLSKDKKPETVQKKQLISNDNQEIGFKRTRSVENLMPPECKKLRRHSLECTSPNKMKQYQNLQEINCIENKLIIDIIEDEVLDVIDKEVSGENSRKKTPPSTNKEYVDCENTRIINIKENEFLDQLDNEMLENSVESKKKSSCRKINFNSTEIVQDNKSKSSWKSIKKFKKTIGKTKIPKKLNISLQSTQRSIKKDTESKLNTSDEKTNIVMMENKTVDFQKMEDYFSRAIPQMIEKNIEETPIVETSNENIYQKDSELNEKIDNEELKLNEGQERDNDSDIYIYQTQPLSKEIIEPKIDKISYAAKLTKKLDNILQELYRDDKIRADDLTSLFPSIENIFKMFDQLEKKKRDTLEEAPVNKIQTSFSEKQIQTDMLSLEGFPITPSAAFKSLIHEDVATQTDHFSPKCPHSCPGITLENSTITSSRNEIAGESQKKGISKIQTLTESSIEFELNNPAPKSQTKEIYLQSKTSVVEEIEIVKTPLSKEQVDSLLNEKVEILKMPSSKKQISSNLNNTGVLFDSQISVEPILEQCNTQFNSAASPIISKMDGNNSASKVEDSNKNESKLNISRGYSLLNEKGKILKMQSLKNQISSNLNNTGVLFDSQISVEHILEQCNTQFNSTASPITSKMDGNNSAFKVEDSNKNESKLNASEGSAIMCSLPRSNSSVNRRLMFEKSLKERNELVQTLKRARSENTSGSEEERPYKVKCNRFLQNDLSIEFESEILNDSSQLTRNSDVQMAEPNENSPGIKDKSISCMDNENENPFKRTQNLGEPTQADTLLNYCDDLIEKANRQILHRNVLSEHNNDMDLSQVLSENNKYFRTNEKLNQSINKKHSEVNTQQNEKIKTQDLLKHYDALIDKASKQIEVENESPSEHHSKKIHYTSSQIPSTSKHIDVFNEDDQGQDQKNVMKTQDLLDHCNALIEKTTKEIARNEIRTLDIEDKNKVQSANDDDFFCQNLDQLDSVLEKENNRICRSKEKLSESLFESCKENLLHETSVPEKKAASDVEDIFSTPKRRKKDKEFKESNPNKADDFNSSDDEIFSDVDVVETTPQKSLSFVERLSCSQIVNQNSRVSLKIQENTENFPSSMDIVPPPPGFDDEENKQEKPNFEKIMGNSERESENVIPTSLSPQRFEVPAPRRPLRTSNLNPRNSAVLQEVTTLSQQFKEVSPICREKSKNMNVIEMVRQSKFSPLTIVPKSNPSVLTSTPKQKSILSYTKPKLKTSQEAEASISTHEKPKPCIAFSRLNNAETLCILGLCNKNLATRQDAFGPDVTHLIVSANKKNHVKDHTIKFISAIAAGIWVLNIKWVQECLAKNCIVDEEPFEVLDITGLPSPRTSRLNRFTNPLLKGFKFYIPRQFNQTSEEDVKNIVQLLQGEVVSSIEELTTADKEKYTCIIISELVDTEDYTQYEDWLMSHKLVTVDINWLSLSVSRYKVQSLRPHLICSDDTIEELGYPSNLVVDVASTLTQNISG